MNISRGVLSSRALHVLMTCPGTTACDISRNWSQKSVSPYGTRFHGTYSRSYSLFVSVFMYVSVDSYLSTYISTYPVVVGLFFTPFPLSEQHLLYAQLQVNHEFNSLNTSLVFILSQIRFNLFLESILPTLFGFQIQQASMQHHGSHQFTFTQDMKRAVDYLHAPGFWSTTPRCSGRPGPKPQLGLSVHIPV